MPLSPVHLARGSRRSLRWVGLLLLALGSSACFQLSLEGKHACDSDDECLEGRVCREQQCVNAQVDDEDPGVDAAMAPTSPDGGTDLDGATFEPGIDASIAPKDADSPEDSAADAAEPWPPVTDPALLFDRAPGEHARTRETIFRCVTRLVQAPAGYELVFTVTTDGSEPADPRVLGMAPAASDLGPTYCGIRSSGTSRLRFVWRDPHGFSVGEPFEVQYTFPRPVITSADLTGVPADPLKFAHFRVVAEPGGSAEALFQDTYTGGNTNLVLYDDGKNGDAVAADGIYELDWQVPFRMGARTVYAAFRDFASNTAEYVQLPTTLSVNNDKGLLVSENIATPTTWRAEDGPVYVSKPVLVDAALTIEPGTEVVFAPWTSVQYPKAYLQVRGLVTAVGSAERPIVMRGGKILLAPRESLAGSVAAEDGSYLAGSRFEYIQMADGELGGPDSGLARAYVRHVEADVLNLTQSYVAFSRIGSLTASGGRYEENYVEQQSLSLGGYGQTTTMRRCDVQRLDLHSALSATDDVSANRIYGLTWIYAGGGSPLSGNQFVRPSSGNGLKVELLAPKGADADVELRGNLWPSNFNFAAVVDINDNFSLNRMVFAPVATELVVGPSW
jgi:hypothetical protein